MLTPRYSPAFDVTRVHALARALTSRGVEVEVLTQDARRTAAARFYSRGVGTRRYPVPLAHGTSLARELRYYGGRHAREFDVIHAHGAHPSLALMATRARPRALAFTPNAPIQGMLHHPYSPIIHAVIGYGGNVLCSAASECGLLCAAFPRAARQIWHVPPLTDIECIERAEPIARKSGIVLSVGRLAQVNRIDRVIASMAAMEPSYRLTVIGDGRARGKLVAHAVDLGVSDRVDFVGWVPTAAVYRWLRTATVFVALAEQEYTPVRIFEAVCAGTPVVASDIAVHREAASLIGAPAVRLVSTMGSPLEVADAIHAATGAIIPQSSRERLPGNSEMADRTLATYAAAMDARSRVDVARS